MKHVLLFSLMAVGMLPLNSSFNNFAKTMVTTANAGSTYHTDNVLDIGSQAEPGQEKMLAVIFKAQKYCRAELKDFEFNAPFNVVGATIYFTGTNFKSPEKGFITSNSLKPVSSFMERCVPGTIVIFDNVTVMGPDNEKRPIAGATFLLH